MKNRPLKPPQTDAEWARNTEQRLRALESPRPLRVGDWVISDQDNSLVATRPGEVLDVGATPVEPVIADLTRGYLDAADITAATTQTSTGTSSSPANTTYKGPLDKVADWFRDRWGDVQTTIDGLGETVDGVTTTTATRRPATTVRTNFSSAWSSIYDAHNGTVGSTNQRPANIYTAGAAVRTTAVNAKTDIQTTVDGVADATNGGTSTGALPATVKSNFAQAWARLFDAHNGTTGNTSKLPSDIYTAGAAVRTAAVNARSEVQSTVDGVADATNGGTSSGAAASTVKTNFAQAWARIFDAHNGTTGATSKLPSDIYTAGAAVRTTAVGAKTDLQTTVDGVADATNGGTSSGALPATVKSNFAQAWARIFDAHNGTTGNTSKLPSDIYTAGAAVRTTATGAKTDVQTTVDGVAQAINGGTATGAAASTIKTNFASAWSSIFDAHNGTSGSTNQTPTNIATAASTVRTTAVGARNTIDLRARDFTNLLPGSDFDATIQPWTLTTGFTISTAQFNSGTQSLLIVGTATANPFVPYNNSQTFEAKPGEKFYMECWVRKSATYVSGDTSGPRLRMVRGNGVSAGTTIDNLYLRASDIADADTWTKLSVITAEVPSDTSSVYFAFAGMAASAAGSLWVDDIVVRRVVSQDNVDGLPLSVPVSDTLIEHAADLADLKAKSEVSVNQGRTMSISFVTQANSSALPTTGTQTWSTEYLSGSGPTFGIASGKAAWVGGSGTRRAKVLYRGVASRTLVSTGTAGTFTLTLGATTTSALAYNATNAVVLAALGAGNVTVSGTNALTGLTITPVSTVSGALSITSSVTGGTATLSDGIESTLTDYQSLRGVLADPPTIFGVESSGFTALARVSPDGNSYVFARAYWQSGLNLKGKIGYVNNGVETVWQDLIPLTWSTELTFKLGIDSNPRSYQVFSGSTLVVSYNEGYDTFAELTALTSKATGRTYVDNTGNRLTVTATGGTFTLSVAGATTGAIAFGATAATVATSINAALNTAMGTTGVVYATVTGTAANTAGTPGGLVITFGSTMKSVTVGNANVSVNPALLTGGSATVTNRYTWSGTAFVPSAATSGAGAASPLGVGNRRFGAEVRISGSNTSGTISSVAVSDNPPVIYAGSVARMTRASTGTASFPTADTGLTSFFDTVAFESLDIDANLSGGTFTVSKSKMYIVTARVRITDVVDALASVNLQVLSSGGSTWSTVQRGVTDWRVDAGFLLNVYPNSGMAGASLSGTWIQYLNAGDAIRLSTQRAGGSSSVLTGTSNGAETYFSISALQ